MTMVLQRVETQSFSGDNLPWVNEFVDETGEVNFASPVTRIAKTLKGYIVQTEDFKGFVFKESKMYDFISEAIKHWAKDGNLQYGIYGIANKQGKLELATDTDYSSVVLVDKKGNVEVKSPNGASASTQEPTNPFLMHLRNPSPTTELREEMPTPATDRKKKPF